MPDISQPPVQPKFVVDGSPLRASLVTIFSLIFFGVTLFGALIRLATAHDLNAIRALLMRDDTIGWLTTVSTLLAPTFWLVWRTVKSWWKKVRDVEIVQSAPNKVAMLKSEVADGVTELPPTRAPETKTRLVGIEGLMPLTSVPMPPVAPPRTVIAGVDVTRPEDKRIADEPSVEPVPAADQKRDNDAAFDDAYAAWVAAGGTGNFADYLRTHGWQVDEQDHRWTNATGATGEI